MRRYPHWRRPGDCQGRRAKRFIGGMLPVRKGSLRRDGEVLPTVTSSQMVGLAGNSPCCPSPREPSRRRRRGHHPRDGDEQREDVVADHGRERAIAYLSQGFTYLALEYGIRLDEDAVRAMRVSSPILGVAPPLPSSSSIGGIPRRTRLIGCGMRFSKPGKSQARPCRSSLTSLQPTKRTVGPEQE